MPTFVPSSYGTPYGTSTSEVVSDGGGTFAVWNDGSVEVLSGYPNVGQVFKPGDALYDQVIKNLSSAGNSSHCPLNCSTSTGSPRYSPSMSSRALAFAGRWEK